MEPGKWEQEYKGYFVTCTPRALPDGKYAPTAVVTHRTGPTVHKEAAVPLQTPKVFESEHEAALAALPEAKQWLDLNPGWAGT